MQRSSATGSPVESDSVDGSRLFAVAYNTVVSYGHFRDEKVVCILQDRPMSFSSQRASGRMQVDGRR